MSKSVQLKNNENEKIYPHPYYPVGSIYLSVNDTNPSKWFGGIWEQIAKGRTLVGVDTNDTDFNTVKKTGGSKYLQEHTHQLDGYFLAGGRTGGWEVVGQNGGFWASDNGTSSTKKAGAGNSGNLQPYFTCYIWCRTA